MSQTFSYNLEWTNQEEFETHIKNLREQYGDQISIEDALNFKFEFNNGIFCCYKESD